MENETFRFYIVTCSCIVELREAVTISLIFFHKQGFFAGFSVYRMNFYGREGARSAIFCVLICLKRQVGVEQPNPLIPNICQG